MRKLIPLLTLFPCFAFGAETAQQAFAKLPPLATVAAPAMDCSAAEVTDRKVQAQVQPLKAAAQSMPMGGSAVQPTPAQIQAMAAMNSPEFNECVTQLQMGTADPWVQALKDRLQANLEQVQAAYIKAIEAFCAKSSDPNCRGSAAIDWQFNAQAAAAGTQFLKDAQPAYARQLKETGDCIARREQGMGGATGGTGNPMDLVFASANGTTWGLLNLPAATNTSLCEAAREAARMYLAR
jgi:hypothetical protein